jgi:hypothetical protein
MKSLLRMAPQAPRHAVQKKQKLFRRETPKTPRFAEKIFGDHRRSSVDKLLLVWLRPWPA